MQYGVIDLTSLGYCSEDCIPGVVWLGGDRNGAEAHAQIYNDDLFSEWMKETHSKEQS